MYSIIIMGPCRQDEDSEYGGITLEYRELRARICRTARQTAEKGLVTGTSGNVSARTADGRGILITPSGIPHGELTPEQIVLVDVDGRPLEPGPVPSSETPMHAAIYRSRPDVCGIVHTHSRYATVLAVLGWEIPPVHYLVALLGGRVPLAPYATFGTAALAGHAAAAFGQAYWAVLLRSHGQVAGGRTVEEALRNAELVEHLAELYYLARLAGEPALLTAAQLADVEVRLQSYGQRPYGAPGAGGGPATAG